MTSLKTWCTNSLFFQHSCISRRQFTALSLQTLLISLLWLFSPPHHTSSSSTHICISLELFMLCFVFNTPSCKKARLPGIKQSKTPLPLKPVPPWLENLWPSHRPWDRSEEEAAWALAETRHPLVFDAPAHFVTLWTYSIPWGWCHWRVPFLSTCPVTWSYLFHLNFASSNIYPSLHFRICYPNQR